MDRIDELKDLIANNKKNCAELKNKLRKINSELYAKEEETHELKKKLLEQLLKNKYPFGYHIYFTVYKYHYNEATWKDQEVKVFDSRVSHKEAIRYFEIQANSYLDWNEIWDKATYKIESDLLFVHQLSIWEVDDLLEELEPY